VRSAIDKNLRPQGWPGGEADIPAAAPFVGAAPLFPPGFAALGVALSPPLELAEPLS